MIYLFPTELEAAPFRLASPHSEVVICGVGMAAAAATLSRLVDRHEEILLAGIAGCYHTSTLRIGEVVEVVSEIVGELPPRFIQRYEVAPRWGLQRVNSNTVSRCNAPHPDCQIENMEGAAIFALCAERGIKVSQIRAISNHTADPFASWQVERAIEALTQTLITLQR